MSTRVRPQSRRGVLAIQGKDGKAAAYLARPRKKLSVEIGWHLSRASFHPVFRCYADYDTNLLKAPWSRSPAARSECACTLPPRGAQARGALLGGWNAALRLQTAGSTATGDKTAPEANRTRRGGGPLPAPRNKSLEIGWHLLGTCSGVTAELKHEAASSPPLGRAWA